MPELTKETLLVRLLRAVELSGWQSFVQNRVHPFIINIWSGDQSQILRVYIWNITSGGPSAVRPQGEFRIQITGVTPPLIVTPGIPTLLLGWSEETGVFTAFCSKTSHFWSLAFNTSA